MELEKIPVQKVFQAVIQEPQISRNRKQKEAVYEGNVVLCLVYNSLSAIKKLITKIN